MSRRSAPGSGGARAPTGEGTKDTNAARRFWVQVKPGARESGLEEGADGLWLARVRAPPVDGKANDELVGLVAARFGCPRGSVRIRAGASGRRKWVEIEP